VLEQPRDGNPVPEPCVIRSENHQKSTPEHECSDKGPSTANLPMSTDDMFSPPLARAMKVLDKSFFKKTIDTSAARIFSPKDISRCRKELTASHDTLPNNRVDPIRPDVDAERAQKGGKCLVLRPEVVHNGESVTARDTLTC
jgi:hypothetical protein